MDKVGKLKCFRRGSCVWPISSLTTCMHHWYYRLIGLVVLGAAGRGFPPTKIARGWGLTVIEFHLRVFRTE